MSAASKKTLVIRNGTLIDGSGRLRTTTPLSSKATGSEAWARCRPTWSSRTAGPSR
jgi:hypothetical protein